MRTIAVTEDDHGRTLASLLRNAMPGAPRAFLRKLARGGGATLRRETAWDGALLGGAVPIVASSLFDARLRHGDFVELRESARVLELLAGGPCPLDVLYDDADLLVLNKTAGLPVHATGDPGAADLATMATALAKSLEHAGAYHVINRLDRWTSGIVLLAPGAARAARFGRLFESREVDKSYLALVEGTLPDDGEVVAPVDGRPAHTTWHVLTRNSAVSLLVIHLHTGRRHQIRRHLAGLGCPLVGDRRYGGAGPRRIDVPGVSGAMLHALSLAFVYPGTGVVLDLVAPVPRHFRDALRNVGIRWNPD